MIPESEWQQEEKQGYESVKNGLQLIEDGVIVGIHDAVRPLVSQEP